MVIYKITGYFNLQTSTQKEGRRWYHTPATRCGTLPLVTSQTNRLLFPHCLVKWQMVNYPKNRTGPTCGPDVVVDFLFYLNNYIFDELKLCWYTLPWLLSYNSTYKLCHKVPKCTIYDEINNFSSKIYHAGIIVFVFTICLCIVILTLIPYQFINIYKYK